MKFDLIVVGDYCADLVFTGMAELPRLGIELMSTGFDFIPGGPYNTVVTAHRLGINVGWGTDFGSDDFSRFVLEKARGEGLTSALFICHDRPLRNVTVSLSFPNERAFITHFDPAPAIPAGFKALAKASARVLFVPGIYAGTLFEAGLAAIRLKGMQLVMDGNSAEDVTLADPAVKKTVRALDVFLPNAKEAVRMTGASKLEEAALILGKLCPAVVIKDGERGALVVQSGKITYVPGIPVEPVDTTGAGDVFNAGFLRGWLDGKELVTCARWGNICGGLSTTARGGTGRKISMREIHEWEAYYDGT